jgi:hypothetical protein
MLTTHISRCEGSPRVSSRLAVIYRPNKDLISGASLLLALALFCALATAAFGQSYQGGLRGSLHDSGGNALANVTLALVNEATSVARTTVTNSSGEYVFDRVDPGKYKLEATSGGFKKLEPASIRTLPSLCGPPA